MRNLVQLTLILSLGLGIAACSNSSDDDDNLPICSDNIDNDNDGKIDFPFDPGCTSEADTDETDSSSSTACSDGIDNDNDGVIDHPNDPGCDSAADTNEADPVAKAACSDALDNDNDGKTDFPNDPGCINAADNDETDPPTITACSDGLDNDSDGFTDFPADPGCTSSADNDETDPVAPPTPICSDGIDNDNDGLTDFPDDPGCISATDNTEENTPVNPAASKTRYQMNNQCWAIKANGNDNFIVRTASGYEAVASDKANAEPFYLKPSALGKYLLYNRNREVVTANGTGVQNLASASATDNSEWTVIGVGDATAYPAAPTYNQEPTPATVVAYMSFVDPETEFDNFTLTAEAGNSNLAIDGNGQLVTVLVNSLPASESFSFEAISGCSIFPEAESNFTGTPFKGTQPDGSVLGHADVHVHVSATEFLGGAHGGLPFHKFGVEHALGSCADKHGDDGRLDVVGGLFSQDTDGHDTIGYPTFNEWPTRGNLTHEAIYWKWLERGWAGGLRVLVNELVENETLCELTRNVAGDPTKDCNSMNNVGEQAGSMYAMMDYIDAQYGGRGAGFFQIVHDPAAARDVIADGNMAVVLGIEISNLFNCQVTYSPFRSESAENETGDGFPENSYGCTVEEGQPNSILTHMQRIHDWGVRKIISIHEFDNAFGGNGIFDGLILNLGTRENSGGIPSTDIASLINLFSPETGQEQVETFLTNIPSTETPTGEYWTTYDCPKENETAGFSGYLWSGAGGSTQDINISQGNDMGELPCVPTGQGGRSGGTTPCYPVNVRQCNARWMTPAGEYTYKKMMEMGFIFDFDHMEVGMKTQALELTEAQDIPYPIVSTHGTFGGTTNDQARRVLANGGILYPSNGSSRGFRADMSETLGLWDVAFNGVANADRPLFGFGYGTDTNGLSGQTGPRGSSNIPAGNEINYPFTLYSGAPFNTMPEFTSATPVVFDMPVSRDINGVVLREWMQDRDGNAHYGMLSDFVQEIRLDGSADDVRNLFNSAEVFLRTWQQTNASSAVIQANGINDPAASPLRSAPIGDDFNSDIHYK